MVPYHTREGKGGGIGVGRRGKVFSLYLSTSGLRKVPGKFVMGSWKVLDFFVNKRVGTLVK